MAATVITSSSASNVIFGATAETGIILSSFSRSVQSSKAELMNEQGDIVALSYYGKTATISLTGAINGSSGVATAAVGGLLTLANLTTEFGVTGGKIVVDSVSSEQGSDAFKTLSVEATQYPSL
jgi:enoyl-[acyl-carrier-protein] reductase (NADH)